MELTEDDDNNSDTQSQHETINPINNSNINEQQTTRESAGGGLSDNESEMELELLAESDTDNESNRSAPNTNTHRTSATAGSENMALFSDDENSDSDDGDSVRSDSVLGEGDDTSQTEPMIFDEARDALAAAAAVSAATTTTTATTIERLTSASSTNTNAPTGANTQTTTSHLTVPRLPTRTAITSSIFGDGQPRRHHIAPVATNASSINQSTSSQPVQQQTTTVSVNTTNSLLARAFGILIRQITDLLVRWPSSSIDSAHINEKTAVDTIQVSHR
jgi:E3 ubiquitin-protein ligase EDD1